MPLLSQGGLPEVVARGNAAFLRHSVQPGEGIFGDTLVPGLVQITHPADLNAQNTTLRKEPGMSSPLASVRAEGFWRGISFSSLHGRWQ